MVANRTAATIALIAAVRSRALRGPASFHLLVPANPSGLHRLVDPEVAGREEAQATLDEALPVLAEASECEFTGEVGSADPMAAMQDVINARDIDEIIVSTLPPRLSRWLKVDLLSKARDLGLPVTHVTPAEVVVHAPAQSSPTG